MNILFSIINSDNKTDKSMKEIEKEVKNDSGRIFKTMANFIKLY